MYNILVSEGDVDMGIEASGEFAGFSREDLELKPQYPVIVPAGLRDSELMKQRPDGPIIFVDSRDPNTATVINQDTWGPKLKRDGRAETIAISSIALRRFAAIILHTSPRTPEDSHDKTIEILSGLLKKPNDAIANQHLGVIAVVEDQGSDTRTGWREDGLRKHGIIIDRRGGKQAVFQSGDYTISMGRVAKKTILPEHLKADPQSKDVKEKREPGDVIELPTTCGDCGQHLKEKYYEKSGRHAVLLIRQVECDNKAHRRGPNVISNIFIRTLRPLDKNPNPKP